MQSTSYHRGQGAALEKDQSEDLADRYRQADVICELSTRVIVLRRTCEGLRKTLSVALERLYHADRQRDHDRELIGRLRQENRELRANVTDATRARVAGRQRAAAWVPA